MLFRSGWLGWALFVVGLVVGAFECAIEYQGGRGSIKDTALNYVKGFMAVSLFSILPVNLYSLSVSLQSSFGSALSGITDAESIGMTAQQVLMSAAMPGVGNPILQIFCAVMMGYAVIKVFFGNLKRGGILLIQIAVGSLYMFSVPRGYIDGFTQWCKQIIGICLTAFLQSTMLTAGLMIFKDHPLLGLGVMLSSTEAHEFAVIVINDGNRIFKRVVCADGAVHRLLQCFQVVINLDLLRILPRRNFQHRQGVLILFHYHFPQR